MVRYWLGESIFWISEGRSRLCAPQRDRVPSQQPKELTLPLHAPILPPRMRVNLSSYFPQTSRN